MEIEDSECFFFVPGWDFIRLFHMIKVYDIYFLLKSEGSLGTQYIEHSKSRSGRCPATAATNAAWWVCAVKTGSLRNVARNTLRGFLRMKQDILITGCWFWWEYHWKDLWEASWLYQCISFTGECVSWNRWLEQVSFWSRSLDLSMIPPYHPISCVNFWRVFCILGPLLNTVTGSLRHRSWLEALSDQVRHGQWSWQGKELLHLNLGVKEEMKTCSKKQTF